MSYYSDGSDADCEPGCVKQHHIFDVFVKQLIVFEHIIMEMHLRMHM